MTLFNVINAKVADKTAGGLLNAQGSTNMFDYLSGMSMFNLTCLPFPDQMVGQESTPSEPSMFDERWRDEMAKRNRFLSPNGFRLPTDLIAQGEPLMTENYFD